jgi:hypothetical protein
VLDLGVQLPRNPPPAAVHFNRAAPQLVGDLFQVARHFIRADVFFDFLLHHYFPDPVVSKPRKKFNHESTKNENNQKVNPHGIISVTGS